MAPIGKWSIGVVALSLVGNGAAVSSGSEQKTEYITRDVCIIGGGASGTYAAVRLQDEGQSVVVVEKEEQLGGHTITYTDPATNQTVDYGVVVFHDIDLVKDYFDRLDVEYQKSVMGGPGEEYYVDIETGELLSNYAPPDPTAALQAYADHLLNYTELERGFYLPDPIPEDLLLPFGEFVEKYNLGDAVRLVATFAEGLGILHEQTTLYVMKNFGLGILKDIQDGFLEAASKNNHEVYDKAHGILGSDVLTESEVISTSRNASDSVVVTVQSPSGVKIIQASKLLVTIPPKLENLDGFDLDATERSLFGQFLNTGYYTNLVRNTGLPENTTSVINTDLSRPYDLPELPGIYAVRATSVPGLYSVKYGSPSGIPEEEVKADIIESLKRLQIPGSTAGDLEFVTFSSHAPFELTVPVEAIESGFYEDLYALQGHRNTFYTGAAFHTQDSSLLWEFTEDLLPQLGVDSGILGSN